MSASLPEGFWDWSMEDQERWTMKFIEAAWRKRREEIRPLPASNISEVNRGGI
jgi:hypothetical protein